MMVRRGMIKERSEIPIRRIILPSILVERRFGLAAFYARGMDSVIYNQSPPHCKWRNLLCYSRILTIACAEKRFSMAKLCWRFIGLAQVKEWSLSQMARIRRIIEQQN